jgi:hypothetical protein
VCYRVCVSVRRRFRRVSCVLSRRNIPLSTPFSGSRCESPVTRGTKESTVEEEVVVVVVGVLVVVWVWVLLNFNPIRVRRIYLSVLSIL